MENYNSGPNAAPPGSNDPNATRFFPSGQGNVPPVQGDIARPEGVEAPRQAYAPPAAPNAPASQQPQPPYPGGQYAGQIPQQPYPGGQYAGQAGPGQPQQQQQYQQPHQYPYPQAQYAPGAQATNGSVDKHDRDRTTIGLILIGGGVLFLLNQLSAFGSFGEIVLVLIGGAFLYAYFRTRPGYRVGFLIPGAILTGIGVGEIIDNFAFFRMGGDVTALTLGLGFVSIWFFERKHWWALIPGTILVLSGLSRMYLIGNLWPLVLIAIGVYLLYGQSRRKI